MWKMFARRTLILIPQLAALSLAVFLIGYHLPGDALTGMISPDLPPQRVTELRALHGLDDPWYVRYVRWTSSALRGDFGQSISYRLPVTDIVAQRANNTLFLQMFTLSLLYLIAIPLGVIAGKYNGRAPEKAVSTYTYLMLATPTVVLALLVIFVFGFRLGVVPVRGSVELGLAPGTLEYFLSRVHHSVAPALTGALLGTVFIIHYLRSEIADISGSDFVTTARSKGVPEGKIYTGHIFRNAVLPIASGVGSMVAALLGGSVFIESIFTYPGMGTLFLESIERRDFSVLNTLVVLYGALIVLGSFLSDIIITVVDPRIRIK
ncbi:MAG: ABC transporter permease [Defluviitaleaceae bacterium]|nr:ABC transporter permease [Defluviitaleaceae bacterium]